MLRPPEKYRKRQVGKGVHVWLAHLFTELVKEPQKMIAL